MYNTHVAVQNTAFVYQCSIHQQVLPLLVLSLNLVIGQSPSKQNPKGN